MADPTTVNIALIAPLRGADPGTWDLPVNSDWTALDGMLGGVATVGVASTPVTLTAPAGSITPTPGPTQAQNAVVKFTGILTANVAVTLPFPGTLVVENLTTGNFVLSFRAVGAGEVIGTPQGSRCRIYNDGTNVRFVEGIEGRPGKLEFEGGESVVPAWITACTVKPFLLCDGTVYNVSDYPYLGAKYLGKFGGNGVTTFAVQDLQGRLPLAYDGTGARITTAGCGLNGQTMGAAIDTQSVPLTLAQLPTGITSQNASQSITVTGSNIYTGASTTSVPGTGGPIVGVPNNTTVGSVNSSGNNNITVTSNNTSGQNHPNVQPSQVAGIWLVKT